MSDKWLITPVWPGEAGLGLLRVALAEPGQAGELWSRVRPKLDLVTMNLGEQRLLPMVYSRLMEEQVADPWIQRFRGVYRNAWVINQRIFQLLPRAVDLLAEAGVPCLVAKGAALAHVCYPDPTWRPMEDFDLLVPEGRAFDAFAAFQKAGWEPGHGKYPLPRHLHLTHSVDLNSHQGIHVDLHWHLLAWALFPGADQHWWEASEEFTLRDNTFRTLCWTDHLLQALVHGMHRNPVATLRWVMDATMLLRQPDRVDWPRLVGLTHKLRQVLLVRETLTYLQREFSIAIPAEVLRELNGVRVTPRQRQAFAFWTSELPRKDPLGFFWQSYAMRQRWIPWWDVPGRVRCTIGQLEMHGGVEGALPALTLWLRWLPKTWWSHSRLRESQKAIGKTTRAWRKTLAKSLKRKRQNLARKITKRLSWLRREGSSPQEPGA